MRYKENPIKSLRAIIPMRRVLSHTLILFALVIVLFVPSTVNSADESQNTHELSIDQLETDDYYLGIIYVQIRSEADDSLIYEGYVINRTMVMEQTVNSYHHQGFNYIGPKVYIKSDHIILTLDDQKYWEDKRLNITIPKEAEYTIGRSTRKDGGELIPANWNLTEGDYKIDAVAYTDEDQEKYDEVGVEYPGFNYEEKLSLDSDKKVGLYFTPAKELPFYHGFLNYYRHNNGWLLTAIHAVTSVLVFSMIAYYLMFFVKEDRLEVYKIKRNLPLMASIPAVLFFILSFISLKTDARWKVDGDMDIFLFYSILFFIAAPIFFIAFRYVLSKYRETLFPMVKTPLFNYTAIYGTIFVYALIIYLIIPRGFTCYAPSPIRYFPRVRKMILVYPLFKNMINKKKLKEELKEEGVYKEEWDEI